MRHFKAKSVCLCAFCVICRARKSFTDSQYVICFTEILPWVLMFPDKTKRKLKVTFNLRFYWGVEIRKLFVHNIFSKIANN